jgi:6,7-dimethyl-8-ribityllumazine synthase
VEHETRHAAGACRFAIVAARFNADFTEGLLRGALAALMDAGVAESEVVVLRVPGAFELPVTARHLAASGRFDAVIALGCLIKGDTMHFEYIAAAVSQGLMQVSTETGIPVAFGVLTTLTEEQAAARSADGPDNKGREVGAAAVEMAALFRRLRQ